MSDTPIRRCKAVLKMPRSLSDKLLKAMGIQAALTNNANFPLPWPNDIASLTKLDADIKAFNDAQVQVQTGLIGTAATRDAKLFVLMTDLRGILGFVQTIADKKTANAQSIIESAGLAVKRINLRGKMQNNAFNTEIFGTVMLTADTSRGHEWQMSKDEKTIINLSSTTTARTFITGLKPGDKWYFRNRKIGTKKTTYSWSPWVELTIGAGGRTVRAGNTSTHAGSIHNS